MPENISNSTNSNLNKNNLNNPELKNSSTTKWTKESIKSLRQRLGWSQAELSRRLQCASSEIDQWETGKSTPSTKLSSELLLLSKQAEACSHEVRTAPIAENICDQKALGQIEFSEIKEEIE